ncbi:hypothetical protein GZL_01994 [Streptomyces sp. 769]|nr:hypothetical protein GZL_01994 [Streptomyces sp. 769]
MPNADRPALLVSIQGVSSSVDRHPHRSAGRRVVARSRPAHTGLRRPHGQ